MELTEDLATRFATIALGHVTREYPNALTHVLDGPGDVQTPRALHPIFYGSFDWHSCVHATWMLARLLYLFPNMPPAAEIRALFDRQITPNAVATECAYLLRPAARGFERPYGWAWFLKLAAAMRLFPDRPWSATLAPLTAVFVTRFTDFLPKATYPVRVGTHPNTAFALALANDYADEDLSALFCRTAEAWYGADAGCQAWEPAGDEFLSPALIEAECMRRLLPVDRFLPWFDRFLPELARQRPASLFTPAVVSDRSDGKIAHLDGLNLSRAWCWRSLAQALPAADPRRAVMLRAAEVHRAAGLPHVAGDYMGEHWLASFAVLALDA
ncbi:MAG: DUF2891 domain-containing protein [Rhodopila sp.]